MIKKFNGKSKAFKGERSAQRIARNFFGEFGIKPSTLEHETDHALGDEMALFAPDYSKYGRYALSATEINLPLPGISRYTLFSYTAGYLPIGERTDPQIARIALNPEKPSSADLDMAVNPHEFERIFEEI